MSSSPARGAAPSWGASSSLLAASTSGCDDLAVLVLNGVNLSQLQARDPAMYGTQSLSQVIDGLREGHPTIEAFDTEHEGSMVERIHQARTDGTAALVINPGAWTHDSHAIGDALAMLTVPKAEVHLSHTLGREDFRRHSTVTPVVDVTVTGLGAMGYRVALHMVLRLARERSR